jgi:hypothetical protein
MYDPGQLLLVSKKPRIQELVARSKSLSEEQIKALPEKPDVIRGLLLINQFGHDQKKSLLSHKIADAMQEHTNIEKIPSIINEVFPIYQYRAAQPIWIITGIHLSEVMLNPDDYWALKPDNQIIFKSNHSNVDLGVVKQLISNSTMIKYGTTSQMLELEQARTSKLL